MALLVLIVEDNPLSRRGLQRLISAEGYQCLTFASAEEAADQAQNFPFDLALLDIQLPGMQGDDFAKLLLKHHKPIVFLTSKFNADRHLEQKIPGCRVLIKPIRIPDLLTLLHTHHN